MALNRGRNRTRRALVDRKTTERDFLIGMREFPPGDSQFVPKQFTELGKRTRRETRRFVEDRKGGSPWMKERSTRTSATREMDSDERLEDNAIIRNYRVRPRLAELSHSVSITGRASLGLSLRFILPLNYPFSLFRSMLPSVRTCIHAVYTYTFMYKCHHTPSKHRREKLIDFERRRHANLARDNAVKSIEFAHRSVNERRNSEIFAPSRIAHHPALRGITSEVSKSNATLLWIHRRDSVE